MMPHISFTEMAQAALFIFVAGMMTGAYVWHRLTRKKG